MSGSDCRTLNLEQIHVLGLLRPLCDPRTQTTCGYYGWHRRSRDVFSHFFYPSNGSYPPPPSPQRNTHQVAESDCQTAASAHTARRPIVTAAHFSHLSMSAVWLSYAPVPVLQRVGRIGSTCRVSETVQDMEAQSCLWRPRDESSRPALQLMRGETTARDTCRVAVWDVHLERQGGARQAAQQALLKCVFFGRGFLQSTGWEVVSCPSATPFTV